MATVVTKTIKPGGGGDYTTLQAAINALPASLVSTDEQWDLVCYGGDVGAGVFGAALTTDATRFVRITVAVGERHAGVFSASKAYATASAQSVIRGTIPAYTDIGWLQIRPTGDDNNFGGVDASGGSVAGLRVHHCLILPNPSSTTFWSGCFGIFVGTDVPGSCYAYNNILYGWNVKTGNIALRQNNFNAGKWYCYNNTIVDCDIGVSDGSADTVVKNCLFSGVTTAASGVDGASDYNASSTGTATGGANDRVSQTFSFVDASGKDYHLAGTDAGAKGFGVDLSGDANLAVVDDIDGVTRSGTWDIGADDYLPPPATEQEGSRFRNDDGSESTATWKAAQDTDITEAAGAARVRIVLNATANPASKAVGLGYRVNGGQMREVH